VGSTKKMKN